MATRKIQYEDLAPELITMLSDGVGYNDSELRSMITYLRDQFDKWLKKPPVEVMTGATANTDGFQGMAPTPLKGQQENVLTGNAKWTPQKDITAGKALADKNNKPIVNYLNNASYRKNDRTLVFDRGDGTKIEVPLSKKE